MGREGLENGGGGNRVAAEAEDEDDMTVNFICQLDGVSGAQTFGQTISTVCS